MSARDAALIPGLHDHHVHLRSAAASLKSLQVGPPQVTDTEQLRRSLVAASRKAAGNWVRAFGYHESVAGDLDRYRIDAMVLGVPVRIQHRSGSLWMMNSAGVEAADLEENRHPGIERDGNGRATGRLWRADHLIRHLSALSGSDLADLAALAASYGVTGFTDATAGCSSSDLDVLVSAREEGRIPQNLHLMAPTGAELRTTTGVSRGPVKVMLDDDTLPSLDQLTSLVTDIHRSSICVAIHCVTEVQLVLALTALKGAGSCRGDRIEHASLFPTDLDPLANACGVTVVTQPHFIAERGDQYLATLRASQLAMLYRCESLRVAGIPLAAGTDAPFGSLDPWAAIAAATVRQSPSGPCSERKSG